MAGAAYLAGRDFTRAFALPVSLGFVIMKSLWWRPLGQGWNTRGSTLWLNATELFNPNSETNYCSFALSHRNYLPRCRSTTPLFTREQDMMWRLELMWNCVHRILKLDIKYGVEMGVGDFRAKSCDHTLNQRLEQPDLTSVCHTHICGCG